MGATSYKDEFTELVTIDNLRELIEPFTILENGYFFVMDENFQVLIHPELEGEYGYDIQNEEGVYVTREITKNLDEFHYYSWKNPTEKVEKEKFVYTTRLNDFNWYVSATGYVDDIISPIKNQYLVLKLRESIPFKIGEKQFERMSKAILGISFSCTMLGALDALVSQGMSLSAECNGN